MIRTEKTYSFSSLQRGNIKKREVQVSPRVLARSRRKDHGLGPGGKLTCTVLKRIIYKDEGVAKGNIAFRIRNVEARG